MKHVEQQVFEVLVPGDHGRQILDKDKFTSK